MNEENALTGSEQPAAPAVEQAVEPAPETEGKTDDAAQASEGQPEPDKSEDATKDEKPKFKSRAREKIEHQNREIKNLKRQLTRANQTIGKLNAERPPREEDFHTAEDFEAAKLRRAAAVVSAHTQFDTAKSDLEALSSRRHETWNEVSAEASQRIPDFEQVVGNPSLPITPEMAELIMDSDQPAELAYYLGKNVHEARRIASLDSPMELARAIGRLEARLSAPKAKTVSSAPKPVPTIAGKASGPPSSQDLHALAKGEDATAFVEEMRRRAKRA